MAEATVFAVKSMGMNDDALIRDNLELSGRSEELDRPWIFRWHVIAYCFAPALLIFVLGAHVEESKLLILTGQFALAFGTCQALYQLSNRPLLNPIQAVVFLFHWWFAIGPGMAVLFARLRGDSALLEKYVAIGGESLWIVAIGLPIYAFFANQTILWSRSHIRHLSFLMPEGSLYRPKTMYTYWLLGGGLMLVVFVLGKFGIVGNLTINYLGGIVSENWFVSSLEAISNISMLATVGVMAYLAGPLDQQSGKLKVVAIGLIILNTVIAFVSGWKGMIVQSFALLFIVMYVWRQKVPAVMMIVLALSYLFIVEPFVSTARLAAEVAQISTPEERVELFQIALADGIPMENLYSREVNIESPFRMVYEFANGIASESTMFEGPWFGTISEGVLALVPRAIYPNKPEGHIGNYFARYLGNDPDNYEWNIGVSIPFEIVGNYGYFMGIVSFMFIGVLWTVFCVWLLSEARLATHPLSPLIIMYALAMEASIGQFLVRFRDLPLVLGASYVLWLLLKKRL